MSEINPAPQLVKTITWRPPTRLHEVLAKNRKRSLHIYVAGLLESVDVATIDKGELDRFAGAAVVRVKVSLSPSQLVLCEKYQKELGVTLSDVLSIIAASSIKKLPLLKALAFISVPSSRNAKPAAGKSGALCR